MKPWIACEDIKPGQKWKAEIQRAMKESSYIITLLSSHSITKTGYVQKELKEALNLLDIMPSSKIFLIPARIEEFEPENEQLQEIQWVDLFPDKEYEVGFHRILEVLLPDKGSNSISAVEEKIKQLKRKFNDTIPGSPEEQEILKQLATLEPDEWGGSQTVKKYTLHSELLTTSNEEAQKVFRLDGIHPFEYIENDFENGGKVIKDHKTGLMWQKSGSDKTLLYKEAQAYINSLNQERFAGYADWRLPTVEELMSLLEPEKQLNGLYINSIFDSMQRRCWSVEKRLSKGAWIVSFNSGNIYKHDILTLDDYYVRMVRSGQ